MTFKPRCFESEKDRYAMADLARQQLEGNLHVTDLPYRLTSWALDELENARLWFDEKGRLVAWAVMNSPFWTIDIVCDPGGEEKLHPEILAWADQRAQAILHTNYGVPCWFITVFSGEAMRIRDIEAAGYQCQADVGEDSWSKVLLRRSVQTPVKVYKPPEGFVVRPLAGADEVKDYVALHQSVFESKSMTVDWRMRTIRHPDYKPELDIVVESPDGRLGAFCICWFDKDLSAGRVEPLGCHQDYRRYALGRVALSEGLHRLQALGAQNIYVETDVYRNTAFRLYELFDFQVIQDVLVYRKDYGDINDL
ncbi:MAG: hypothetical protein JW726_02665 [Anaerolineales bacterium]|nr:hypothetical protein [Anaerolineales bacterium]